jgi:hypothetical protein
MGLIEVAKEISVILISAPRKKYLPIPAQQKISHTWAVSQRHSLRRDQ